MIVLTQIWKQIYRMSNWVPSPANNKDWDGGGGRYDMDIPIEFVLYAIIAILLMIVVLMIKLVCDNEGGRERGRASATESSRLLSSKDQDLFVSFYGTTSSIDDEDDLESGNSTSSSDGKICVICYDHQRTCFFVPCGHSITCFACAKRIISEENKSCPICRTCINRVRIMQIE